jgi:hypothetical protein
MSKKLILRDCYIEVNGVDLSDHCSAVTITLSKDDIDTTNFSGGGREHQHGLKDDTFEITLQQDFNAASVDSVLFPLYDQEDEFYIYVLPTQSLPVGATNPSYSATCLLLEYSPLDGAVGKLSDTKVKFVTQRDGITRSETS